MEFPRYVWRHGAGTKVKGGGYDALHVKDAAEHKAALADGWTDDLQAAIDNTASPVERVPTFSTTLTEAAPTRAELEQKAHELGVKFAPQLGDVKLAERIEAALKAKAEA